MYNSDMINTTIGKYKITRLIGEGGMASVFEAEHEMLGTRVAIKVLNPILSTNTQIKERFRNEARLMASLDHPNITKVIDFDEQPQQLSIIMEYLSGENLNEKIKRNGPLSENEITDIFSQTFSAFQHAHQKGIIHRDIKPSNIFILTDGRIKILDFGIAKLFGQTNEMTQTGTQIGTPVYMSPEQVKADKTIDQRSDIYSLGVTMFFAINGKPPYNSETDSQFDIFTKIVYEPLPEFRVKSKFKDIVLKACNKNREDRFQTCTEYLSEFNSTSSINSESLENTLLDLNSISNNKVNSIIIEFNINEEKQQSSKINEEILPCVDNIDLEKYPEKQQSTSAILEKRLSKSESKNGDLNLPTYEVYNKFQQIEGNVPSGVPKKILGLRITNGFNYSEADIYFYGNDYGHKSLIIITNKSKVGIKHCLDFTNFIYAPLDGNDGNEEWIYQYQTINWAIVENDILYVSHGHLSYAKMSQGKNAYISAIDLKDYKILWTTEPLTCNSTFSIIGNSIICGYGFTEERDYLFVVDKKSGKRCQQLDLESGPEYIIAKNNKIFVRTYNKNYVFELSELK
jgi:serine/threonine protein kinase